VNLMTFRCRISLDPQTLDIVSLFEIALCLLVAPVYLSRIRKNSLKNPANKTCFISKSFFLPNFAYKKLANEK